MKKANFQKNEKRTFLTTTRRNNETFKPTSATSTSQSAVLFSHNKSAPTTRPNQPNRVEGSKKRNLQRETGAEKRCEK